MGRLPGDTVLFLFDYTSSGSHSFGNFGSASYFSVDGGKSVLADFGVNSDPGDFLNNSLTVNDPFDEFYTPGSTLQSLTALDQTMIDMLGFGGGTTTIVSSGQTLTVSAGQTSTGITVESGGTLIVASGGTASGTTLNGGTLELFGNAVNSGFVWSGGTLELGSGFTLSGRTVGTAARWDRPQSGAAASSWCRRAARQRMPRC
jgi:autotransporter passenger strand-loop-strand repeat protein